MTIPSSVQDCIRANKVTMRINSLIRPFLRASCKVLGSRHSPLSRCLSAVAPYGAEEEDLCRCAGCGYRPVTSL